MFEILFLGTSASAPSARRGLSACVVQHDEHRFLIDCGEGTQRQILQSGLGFKHINRILLTHHHLDHILGLGGLMSTFLRWENIDKMEIFGGKTTLERVKTLLFDVVLAGRKPPMPLVLRQISPGVIVEEADFQVRAIPVTHRGSDCFGYIFEEKARRPFLNDRATELGLPFGPERSHLVRGENVTLADGRVITPDDVLGPWQPGLKLAVIGDTGRTNNLLEEVRGADALVIESTYLQEDESMAREFSHLTARDAAELGKNAGVKQLLLTHISRRYREKEVLAEAQAVFGAARVMRDFDNVIIKREG